MEIPDQSIILFIFLCLSAFFSSVETAFISISDIRIQHLIEQNRRGIHRVKKLKDNYQRLLITILIGNNLVNISASSIATSIAIRIFESNAIGIAVGIMTILILIFGEIVPKNIAMAKNEPLAIFSAPILQALQYILYPVIKILEIFTVLLSMPFDREHADPIITEAEIKSVVTLGEEIGEVEEDERIMIHNIFRFSDLRADEIMVDRTHMFSIDSETPIEKAASDVVAQGYSRIPVYKKKSDNVIGILYAKDILEAILKGHHQELVKEIVRPAMFIPESMLLDDLLTEFQKEQVHIALVTDEHGGICGLVTIEDLLEEIVGEIYDETDDEEIMIRKIDDHKSIVKGETEIEDVNRELQLNLSEKEDYETISGFILSKLRFIPAVGEELKTEDAIIRVTKADARRIIEVEIEKQSDMPVQDIRNPT
ncbi:MAG: HlyC/CorC family transporter [Desulfobacteraceae bacterium]|nr:MAG: HlyC/CorC family transporter [Desulfobacteraceae bacterium]